MYNKSILSVLNVQMIFTIFKSAFLCLWKCGKQRGFQAATGKKGLYLELSRKDHSSGYSKGELTLPVKTHYTSPFALMPLCLAFQNGG